jgi:hypothetical protein
VGSGDAANLSPRTRRETEGERATFGQKKKGPTQPTPPFTHADGCKLVKADPGFEPQWTEVESGHWRRECQCYAEDRWEPRVDRRTRLDPLDPATSRHAPQCEHRDVTDPAIIRAILRVHDSDGYWFVECGTCEHGWQVPYYATESVG